MTGLKELRTAHHVHSMFIERPMYKTVPLSLIRAMGLVVYWICSGASANPAIHTSPEELEIQREAMVEDRPIVVYLRHRVRYELKLLRR